MFSVGLGFPGTRLMIKNKTGDRIIQIQNGALNFNWVGQGEGDSYPRYEKIQEEFFEALQKFRDFIAVMGNWNPNQWEVTYFNHLPKGTVWSTPEDLGNAFASCVSLPYRLPNSTLEAFGGQWRYEIEPRRGRLYVDIQHVDRMDGTKEEMLALKLTARGQILPDKSGWSLNEGLGIGHKVVVEGFAKLASEKAKEFWRERK
jgi:uncharacterized protein (TIGR04255 family)